MVDMTKRGFKGRHSGLTLIELMVVIAVLAILTAIGYPMYTEQVQKARRTDARNALSMIALAQERFYTVNGTYADALDKLELPADLQAGASMEGHYDISIVLPDNNLAFLISATPAAGSGQAKDEDCTELRLDQTGLQFANGADTDNCW